MQPAADKARGLALRLGRAARGGFGLGATMTGGGSEALARIR